jgi:SAM-dependent methyltransferase
MRVLIMLVFASCAHSAELAPAVPAPTAPPTPPTAAPTEPALVAPSPPAWEDAKVVEKSQAFLAAVDKYDYAAYTTLADPAIVNYESGRTGDTDSMKRQMSQQLGHLPARTRTCSKQRVTKGQSTIVYVDLCEITLAAHDDAPNLTFPKWDSIIWGLRDGAWKVIFYQEQSAGLESERDAWNEEFRVGVNFKTTANQLLIDTVKGRKPGKALDVAMGQGRNAVFLATQGWKVTGVDISDEGMKIAQDKAAKQKKSLETINHDMKTFDYGKNQWDLVTMIYAGSNHDVIEKIKASIKKGGLFVVEFFAKESTANTGIGGFEPGELAALFNDGNWTIIKDEVVEDTADWGLAKSKLVRFTAQKKK